MERDNDESIYLNFSEEPKRRIVDGIEFKIPSDTSGMSIFGLLKCAHTMSYFQITATEWKDFKKRVIKLFSTPLSRYGKAAILHTRIPEEAQHQAISLQAPTDTIFSIDEELKACFNNAFCDYTHFSNAQETDSPYQMDVIVCDLPPISKDFACQYHPVTLDALSFSQICHLCKATGHALHFHFEMFPKEINKENVFELIHTHLLKKHPLHQKSRLLIQISLLWEDESYKQCTILYRILKEIFPDEYEYFDIGFAGIETPHFEIDIFLSN